MTDRLNSYTTAYEDPQSGGDGLLRLNWHNGDPKLKTPGTFFVETDRIETMGVAAPGEPWAATTRTFNDGRSKEGYACAALRLIPIGMRQQDIVMDGEGKIVEYLDKRLEKAQRPQGWSVMVELLCIARGFDHGPVVWRSKRVTTSMAIIIDVGRMFRDQVVGEARKHYKNAKIPAYTFWMPVRGKVDQTGAVVYEQPQARGAFVTRPTLVLPEKKSGADLFKALYVGDEVLDYAEGLRGEFSDWLAAKPGDGFRAAEPEPELKNAPQPVEDDRDLPF